VVERREPTVAAIPGARCARPRPPASSEYDRLATREDWFAYVKDLFARIKPYAHRFMLAASCSTSFTARWETLVHFRDAWQEYGGL
jgi:hypothetical protein